MTDLGWFVLHGEALTLLLERARAGEDPALLIVELAANSEMDEVDGDV